MKELIRVLLYQTQFNYHCKRRKKFDKLKLKYLASYHHDIATYYYIKMHGEDKLNESRSKAIAKGN